MPSKEYQTPSESERISASDLRQRITDKSIEEAKKRAANAREKDTEKQHAYQEFLQRKFTENDRLKFRGMGERAADKGLFEIQILTFPSEYLEDHGRRINNFDKDWPVSLTGFAKACYDAYVDLAKPQGYKIIAKVLDYPNGMIGDIGLYLSWKD